MADVKRSDPALGQQVPEQQESTGLTTAKMAALGMVVAGFATVDGLTNDIIPQTARHFTDDAFWIGFIIALNRLFGFLVQPYIAWKSDHVQTRFGRRRPFFLVSIPLTIVSLLIVGAFPMLVPESLRYSLPIFMTFIGFNILLQAVQDVNWGAQPALYADMFPQSLLGRAVSIRHYIGTGIGFVMTLIAMRLADRNLIYPYLFSCGFMVISYIVVVFGIKEKPMETPLVKERYSPFKHLSMLRNIDFAKLAVVGAILLTVTASYNLFLSLFVTRTLGFSNEQFGDARTAANVARLLFTFPIGYCIDRYGPKVVLSSAFFLQMICSILLIYWVQDYTQFFTLTVAEGIAMQMLDVPLVAMIFQYASKNERGSMFGLIQYGRGLTAFTFSLLLGWGVKQSFSHDPTPFYAEDFKDPIALIERIQQPGDPVAQMVAPALSADTIELMGTVDPATDLKPLRQAVAEDLNAVIKGPGLYKQGLFNDDKMSKPLRDLVERQGQLSESEQLVMNRSLLQGHFDTMISVKADYRFSFKACAILALIGGLVTLSTRRGKYAETIRDRKVKKEIKEEQD